jgi:hypothetical protein
MVARAIELDLPLGDAVLGGDIAGAERRTHLLAIPGIDAAAATLLARTFPSLAAVYAADEARLAAVVGPVAAARMRWFLDAPISAAALPGRRRRAPQGWHHRAA